MYIVAHNGAPLFGGAEKATALLLAGLGRRGHRVKLYCNSERVAERAAGLGLETQLVRLGGDAMLQDALRFAWLLRKERPDVVLLSTFRKLWLGGLAAWLAGVPRVVARVGLSGNVPKRWKYRVALRRWVDVVVLNAEALRADFLKAARRLDPGRVVTIHTGVTRPERRSPPGTLRRTLGVPADALVIGTLARLAWQKRLDRLIHAFAALPSGVHCIIAGEDEDGLRPALLALAERLGVRDRLHILGFRSEVADVLDALDVYVVSSDREGLSNAMLEAMAAGIPVVSTPVSGASEALEPFPDGTAPGEVVGFTAEELSAALSRLLADAELRRAMGAAAVRRVAERFDFERMLDDWERLLAGAEVPGRDAGRHSQR